MSDTASIPASRWATVLGRPFVNPAFDYILIGGGLSLAVTVAVVVLGADGLVASTTLPFVFLLSNSAHFAASTVRLYSKPGAVQAMPFLTKVFPLLALVSLTLCIAFARTLGPHLQSLYLTWSPYHYAATAYGLAVMYSYRAGCKLSATDKRLLWWVGMLPFFYNALLAENVGLHWLFPEAVTARPVVIAVLQWVQVALPGAIFLSIALLVVKVWRGKSGPMPAIAALLLVSNGVWWVLLMPLDAFFWATIFHGIQYLAIVVIFHVQDQTSRPGNRRGPAYHVIWFYGTCVLLGYALFQCLPLGFVLAGFGLVESQLLVVAMINIHHFIVDAYIWRLKQGDGNRRVVDEVSARPAGA